MDDKVAEFVQRYESMGLEGTPASPEEVAALEQKLGLKFPAAYKVFLFILGRDGGPDFIGSDCTIRHLPKLRRWAEVLLQACGAGTLPEKAFVYIMHQGYSFHYFIVDQSSEDPAVYAYVEGDPAPVKKAESFTAWLLQKPPGDRVAIVLEDIDWNVRVVAENLEAGSFLRETLYRLAHSYDVSDYIEWPLFPDPQSIEPFRGFALLAISDEYFPMLDADGPVLFVVTDCVVK